MTQLEDRCRHGTACFCVRSDHSPPVVHFPDDSKSVVDTEIACFEWARIIHLLLFSFRMNQRALCYSSGCYSNGSSSIHPFLLILANIFSPSDSFLLLTCTLDLLNHSNEHHQDLYQVKLSSYHLSSIGFDLSCGSKISPFLPRGPNTSPGSQLVPFGCC